MPGRNHYGAVVHSPQEFAVSPSRIAARTPGRQLNTTMGDYSGRPAYFVQWQTPDGRVMIFIVDAESGQILSRQG